MSRALRLLFVAVIACILQTNLAGYIRIAGVAPDLMIVALVLLTSYTGSYGGFCTGSVMALLYDASVGYILAINLIGYTFIGYIAPLMRKVLDEKLKKLKHKSDLVMTVICFFLTLMREILYIGYLFLIGSEQSMITVVRALLCAGYSALLITPGFFLMKPLMRVKVIPGRKKKGLCVRATELFLLPASFLFPAVSIG